MVAVQPELRPVNRLWGLCRNVIESRNMVYSFSINGLCKLSGGKQMGKPFMQFTINGLEIGYIWLF